MKPSTCLIVAFLFAILVPIGYGAKPNIIVIYADDMGYGDCTVNNPESKIPTPNIDRLAKQGMRFTDAHSPSSTCTASRYGLLTGTCPVRRGVVNGLTGLGPVIDNDEVTIADFLKDQGYITRMIGKWHLGFELHAEGAKGKSMDFSTPLSGGPLDCGFDSYFGVRKAVSGPPYFLIRGREPVAKPSETTPGTKKDLKTNGKDVRTAYPPGDIASGFVPEACNAMFCDEAVKILKEHAASDENQPLFLYYAMLEPHTPWLPTEEFAGKSKAGSYGDYIVQLDHEVGRVLEALKESGLQENTMVIFSSDNGAMWRPQDIEQFGHRANGIFSGTKGTAYEGGHRVPMIVRWPGIVPESHVSGAVINHTDLFATLADLFDIDIAKTSPGCAPDSHSFLSVLRDPANVHRRSGMPVTPNSYRLGDWKLRFRRGGGVNSSGRSISNAFLYNLAEDPAEENDLSQANTETKQRLFAEHQAFMAAQDLKPLAKQVAAKKDAKKSKTPKTRPRPKSRGPKPAPRGVTIPENLSEEQRVQIDRVTQEYTSKLAELQKKLTGVLTNEQQAARRAGQKKAIAEGKKGVRLRAAADAAANMTAEQKKRVKDLRQEITQLARQRRAQMQSIVQKSSRTP